MQSHNSYSGYITAALSAFILSLVLIAGTVSLPGHAHAAGSAYMGVVA